jgi:hypothetical protein
MAKANAFDKAIFLATLSGVVLGAAVGVALLLWVVPAAGKGDYRPAVLSTVVVPLGCLIGWLDSGSRERAPTAAVACFGLYFLSAFAAARLGTFFAGLNYFWAVVGVQGLGGLGLAVLLGFLGPGVPQVERLKDARDVASLAALLCRGSPRERLEAARALGSLGEASARPALLEALGDPSVPVCREAAAGLVGLATAEDVPALQAALQHSDPVVRRRARQALRWIGT